MSRGWVLVTGASRGIGEATAVRLAKLGFDLVLWARSVDGLAATAAQATAAGVQVRTTAVDVGVSTEVARAARDLADCDQLSGVVLNAGVGRWASLAETPLAEWEATVRTNLDGAYHVLRATVPMLAARRAGLLVGILSDSVLYPQPERAAYTAAKAGMGALLEVVRREVRDRNVRVTAVLPSRVDTYFQGAHPDAAPGTRAGALRADDVAEVVGGLFELPEHVEVRQLHMAAMTSTYGPFPERVMCR